jgi:hypothetical protein
VADPWKVVFTPEAQRWFNSLDKESAHAIGVSIREVQRRGPVVGEPYVKRIVSSRHHNMKEFRSIGGNQRALFAFDRNRQAVVFLGGDKTNNWKGWYKEHVPRADRLYDLHLRDHGGEGPSATRGGKNTGPRGR